MPEITVQALVVGPDGTLVVRERGAAEWRLPGGPLLDSDESVEQAILREVQRWLRLSLSDDPEFLDTLYERRPGGETVVHNVFLVPQLVAPTLPAGVEGRWVNEGDLSAIGLADWLRRALQSAFGAPVEPDFDLQQIEATLERSVERAPVIVVTGPAGAGKTTVARELCRRFARAAHVSVDLLRHMVVSGFASPIPGQSDPAEAEAQIGLATLNAAMIARNFSFAGMVAVIDDVLETRAGLDDYLEALGPEMDVRVVTLLPNANELARRDGERPVQDRMGTRCEELRRIIAGNGETRGIRLDTSAWTAEQTVDVILERLEEARVAPAREESL